MSRDLRARLLMMLILAGTGIGAFLVSAILLRLGFTPMGWRYLIAAVLGYFTFVALIRAWISLHRGEDLPDAPLEDVPFGVPDLVGRAGSNAARTMFGGGRSGGGGASMSWHSAPARPRPYVGSGSSDAVGEGIDWAPDDAKGWLVVAAGFVALAGLIASAYVVYLAPTLLAEVAFDAAIVSALYQRIDKRFRGDWMTTVVRHTWIPALVVTILVTALGFLIQAVLPAADSIGDIFR
jgi:hypothetical protein